MNHLDVKLIKKYLRFRIILHDRHSFKKEKVDMGIHLDKLQKIVLLKESISLSLRLLDYFISNKEKKCK